MKELIKRVNSTKWRIKRGKQLSRCESVSDIQFRESSVDYNTIQVIINSRNLQIVTPMPGKRISVIRYRRISLGIFMWPFNGVLIAPPRRIKQ